MFPYEHILWLFGKTVRQGRNECDGILTKYNPDSDSAYSKYA